MQGIRTRASAAAALLVLSFAACKQEIAKPVVPDEPPPGSPEALIQAFATAYQKLSYAKLAPLFADEARAMYSFYYYSNGGSLESWDLTEELRIHRRMFGPGAVVPPVPPELRPQAIMISLTRQTEFVERWDLYRSATDSTGLDPHRWIALEARYEAQVEFTLSSDNGYFISGIQSFIVIEDLTKKVGEARKFQIYLWTDLARPPLPEATGSAVVDPQRTAGSWAMIKSLYR